MSKFKLTGRRAAGIAATVMMAGGLVTVAGVAQQASAATGSAVAVTAGQAVKAVTTPPVLRPAHPPLRVTQGAVYAYRFLASGNPAPQYALVGAPRWLSINRNTGQVIGRVPLGTQAFSYIVVASNSAGIARTQSFHVLTLRLPQTIHLRAPHTGAVGRAAVLTAVGGRSGRPVTLSVDRASGRGVCQVIGHTVLFRGNGICVVDANQAGNAIFAPARTARAAILVGRAPHLVAHSPAKVALARHLYAYRFLATGSPAPRFALTGAPSWLRINSVTGQLAGVVPAGTHAFRYAVTAVNAIGHTTQVFTVSVR